MNPPSRLLVSTRKGLFGYEKRGDAWEMARRSFLGDNVTFTLHDPRDGAFYAALNHGHFGNKLHRSRDGGETWDEIACPAYPPMPEGYEEPVNEMNGKPTAWALQLLWCLAVGHENQPGRLYAGTIPGGLFVSDDHGDNWSINEPLWMHPKRPGWFGGGYDWPGIHSICVDPRPENRNSLRLGVSCGGVWATHDGGKTWTQRAHGMRADYAPPGTEFEPDTQDPHLIVQCPGAPDHFWAQHHNGIFRSTDNAQSWEEISGIKPSGFGFAVAVHPTDPDTAWFVPAIKDEQRIPTDGRLLVNRTTDGGRTFTSLVRGLPQHDAYDLVFRHALAVAADGQTLAFGSTTGNLYASPDGGEHFDPISTHLPPIHAVAFG